MTSIVITCKNRDGMICKLYGAYRAEELLKRIKEDIDYFKGKILLEKFIPFQLSYETSYGTLFIYAPDSDIKGDISCELIHNGREVILKE